MASVSTDIMDFLRCVLVLTFCPGETCTQVDIPGVKAAAHHCGPRVHPSNRGQQQEALDQVAVNIGCLRS